MTGANYERCASVIIPDIVRRPNDLALEQAFREYVELARKAQSSRDLTDAIAAGKAWGRFVYLFCSE